MLVSKENSDDRLPAWPPCRGGTHVDNNLVVKQKDVTLPTPKLNAGGDRICGKSVSAPLDGCYYQHLGYYPSLNLAKRAGSKCLREQAGDKTEKAKPGGGRMRNV